MVVMFAIFNVVIQNYVGVLSNAAVFISGILSLIKGRK